MINQGLQVKYILKPPLFLLTAFQLQLKNNFPAFENLFVLDENVNS